MIEWTTGRHLMESKLTTPAMHRVEAANGLQYLIDPIARPIEARIENWGDCAIKAMALALHRPYVSVLDEVIRRQGYHIYNGRRSRKKGTQTIVIMRMMEEAGWEYITEKRRINSKSAVARLPREAILDFPRHVAYIKDGIIHDGFVTWRECGQTRGWWVPKNRTRIVTIQEVLARKKEPRRNLIVQYRADRDVLTSEADKALWDTVVASDLTEEEYALYINIYRKAA
jgi:hypothetical protein